MTLKDFSPKLLYPDEYIVEEDEMGDSSAQEAVLDYLKKVLRHLYEREQWMVAGNRNHYHAAIENSENLIVPDIAIFKGIYIPLEEQETLTSWDMRKGNKACPPLVIESSSGKTYKGDIDPDKKPRLYGLIGVKEYFAYDPNRPQVWPKKAGTRLLGWRYDEQGNPTPIKANEEGRMWSEVLDSWLGADGPYLRLYDRNGVMRLTGEEADKQRANIEAQRAKAEAQRANAEVEARQRAETQARIEAEARQVAESYAKAADQRLAELERQLEELRRKND